MFLFIQRISILFFIISALIYTLIVIKEKVFLKKNMIVLNNRHITQEDINEADIKEFVFLGIKSRTGDEVKVITKKNEYEGTLIGIKYDKKTIHILTYENELKKIDIGNVEEFKMLNKYGSFF